MKKLSFVFSVILILLFTSIYNLSAAQSVSLTLSGRVLPQVNMSISENFGSRSINPETGAENPQIFTINISSNIQNGYQIVIESQNRAANQTELSYLSDQNDAMSDMEYAIYFNNQVLNLSSGQAVAKSTANPKDGNSQSNLEITKTTHESTAAKGPYKDTILVIIVAN